MVPVFKALLMASNDKHNASRERLGVSCHLLGNLPGSAKPPGWSTNGCWGVVGVLRKALA
jgi:hypothetical protein